ncbi:hypothetical protein, partial [Sulfurovum sp.]|uniref:hypothetical protein n=1 Tax=Sulfurovum sp. TaxID=1969726 RepID=UPI0025DA7F2C
VNNAIKEVKGKALTDKLRINYEYFADVKIAVTKTLEELKTNGWISGYSPVEVDFNGVSPKIEYSVSPIPTPRDSNKINTGETGAKTKTN